MSNAKSITKLLQDSLAKAWMADYTADKLAILQDLEADTDKRLKELLLSELIGEDEPVQYVDDEPATELDDYAETRNELRQSLRIKLNTLFGEEK